MVNFDALVLTQIFRRLKAKIYEVHEHLVITLLATLINLQKVLEELFVVRITFLNKNLRQEYDFAFALNWLNSSLVVLKHIDE